MSWYNGDGIISFSLKVRLLHIEPVGHILVE